jgi:FIMAH domain
MEMRILQFSRAWLALIVVALWCGGTASRAAAQCATFPSGYVPFTQVYATYPTSPGSIVVGAMTAASYSELSSVPLPSSIGQEFCAPVQLAPDFFVIAYVPTAAERYGDFSAYLPGTQLYDPINGTPYLNNQINPASGVFAWHIVGPALSPAAATQAIISQVNALYSQGVLNSGQANSLERMLANAIKMINAGKKAGAIGILKSFISEVQDLESSRILTLEQATLLINAANAVIAELT